MPVPLVYEISVIGEDKLKRALRSIESEAKASSSRTESESRRSVARRTTAARDPVAKQAARGFDQIGRAARAAENKQIRDRMAGDKRASSERLRHIAQEERAAIRAAKAAANAQLRGARAFSSRVVGSVGGSVKKVVGMGANALALGGGLLGGMAATNALQSRIAVHAAAANLANQAFGNPGEKRSREQIQSDVLKQIGGIDKRTGIGEESAIGGLRSFAAVSGELGAGQKLLPFMANLADATDANIGDVGGMGAQAYKAVRKAGGAGMNEEDALSQTKDIMASIAQQTKLGSIEMQDYASHMIEITNAAGRFQGSAPTLIKFMSALGQLSGYDSAEAATAVARVPSDLLQHSKEAGALLGGANGIFTDAKRTQIQDPAKLIPQLIAKSGGDLTKLNFLGERSVKAFMPLQQAYSVAERNKKGTGMKAMQDMLSPFMAATMSEGEIGKSAVFRQTGEDRQISKAMGEFNRQVGDKLLPALEKMIPKFAESIPALTTFAGGVAKVGEWLVNNPWTGLGALVAGVITKDLASAGIGLLMKEAIAAIMLQGGVMSVAGSGVSALAGGLGVGANAASGALGMGAAGAAGLATAGAGLAAVGGVAAAGYQAYQLSSENAASGGIWKNLMEAGNAPARSASGADYDRLVGGAKGGGTTAGATATAAPSLDTSAASKGLADGATRAGDAFLAKVAMADLGAPRRSIPIGAR